MSMGAHTTVPKTTVHDCVAALPPGHHDVVMHEGRHKVFVLHTQVCLDEQQRLREAAATCCCGWGAAVGKTRHDEEGGEWPEFECVDCEVHGGTFAGPNERCKRHAHAAAEKARQEQTAHLREQTEAALAKHNPGAV